MNKSKYIQITKRQMTVIIEHHMQAMACMMYGDEEAAFNTIREANEFSESLIKEM